MSSMRKDYPDEDEERMPSLDGSGYGECLRTAIVRYSTTVDSLITHTPRDRPNGMGYKGVWVLRGCLLRCLFDLIYIETIVGFK